MTHPHFEKNRFPLAVMILLVALALIAIPRVPQIAAMLHRTPHTHHWQVERSPGCEHYHYIDDMTHREVGDVFHCGDDSTWDAASFEGWNWFNHEKYETKEQAIRRIEDYIQ